jgi:endonuclease/exonuclease/phosphatase family metal-dependent hydrolase
MGVAQLAFACQKMLVPLVSPVLVVSWNIHAVRGSSDRRLDAVVDRLAKDAPDLVMLQEVSTRFELPERLLERLEAHGYPKVIFSGDMEAEKKRYGNIIASRYALTRADNRMSVPWPQLVAHGRLAVLDKEVDVVTAHVPNGSGNGWRKAETFEGLADYLRNAPDAPRILAGDFNEPRAIRPNGQIVTFGQKVMRNGRITTSGKKTDKFGETHPRYRWDHAVRSVLIGPSSHGLRHAYLSHHGPEYVATHIVRGNTRFFDHILVSAHFEVEDAGFWHDCREDGTSDHSAAWARLSLRD